VLRARDGCSRDDEAARTDDSVARKQPMHCVFAHLRQDPEKGRWCSPQTDALRAAVK